MNTLAAIDIALAIVQVIFAVISACSGDNKDYNFHIIMALLFIIMAKLAM